MTTSKEIEERIYSTFSEVASSIGYSPLHGKIIGVLLVKSEPTSLQDLAKETGYSASMISLSIDFLEVLGVVKKVKKTGDRKLYLSLHGDLLEALKTAIVLRTSKSIKTSLTGFEEAKKDLKDISSTGKDKERIVNTIDVLEKEIKRLDKYMNILSKIRLP
ncbi:MAG: hypothetical protein KKB03_04630 [Nanoarchaeota archaeon]|nr:hypothetical protein [Nanoarchaeota archaeon]MBU1135710.1 hypothetical protein [Nanoarchaeota archaeon]MBU2520498.1 hypothetical protein [Nanoarchaeota archaeon]